MGATWRDNVVNGWLQVNTGDKGPDFSPDRTSESSVAAAEMVNYCPLTLSQ